MKKLAVSVLLSIIHICSYGQCAITAGADTTIPCSQPITLHAYYDATVNCTGNYYGTSIPFTPFSFSTGTAIPLTTDDRFSNSVSIPFTFSFFGVAHNNLVIGANGSINFNTSMAGNMSDWSISGGLPGINSATTQSGILAAYSDLANTTSGTFYTSVYGTAPCRKFVISFDSIPQYMCTTSMFSSQVVLHEGSNIIDIFVKNRSSCPSWNSDYYIVGIENSTGTIYYAAPGMNPGTGAITNFGYRFAHYNAPTGAVTWNWYNTATGSLVGTGQSINITPTATTKYTVVASYVDGCDTISLRDTIKVNIQNGVPGSFSDIIHYGCGIDTLTISNTTTSTLTGAFWDFGFGATSSSIQPIFHLYPDTGSYTIVAIMYNGTCTDTVTQTIDLTPTLAITGANTALTGTIVTVNATLLNLGTHYTIYWYDNGILIDSSTVPSFSFTKGSGVDTITAAVVNSDLHCSPTVSNVPLIITSINTGIYNTSENSINIYPNPTNNKLHLDHINNAGDYRITNTIGAIIQQGHLQKGNNIISLQLLPTGIYILQYHTVDGIKEWKKIIKE
ncbi:MAG: T9SS type A sorting domain-containing protein [Bacteroidota bacterium]